MASEDGKRHGTCKSAIIIGAGPSGLGMAASFKLSSIPYTIIEREDTYAPTFTKKAYDRLCLHLPKAACQLPFQPFPDSYPTFVPKKQFVSYLGQYVTHFEIEPNLKLNRAVTSAHYDDQRRKWCVRVSSSKNVEDEEEEFWAEFLVVATGENCDPFVPDVDGLKGFPGEWLHGSEFKNGKRFEGKSVLVVGSGNTGLEVACDLADHKVQTSIVIKSPTQFVTKRMMQFGFFLFKYFSIKTVEKVLRLLTKFKYGDMVKYGIQMPEDGPFTLFGKTNKYPTFDTGICRKIRTGEIQVLPAVQRIVGNMVELDNGKSHPFDAIIFATGYRRSTNQWLKGDNDLLNEDGLAKKKIPNHWKGENGLYCVGLARRGLLGISFDVNKIAEDIKNQM